MIQVFAIIGLAAIIFGATIGVWALFVKLADVLSRRHEVRLQTGSLLRSLNLRVQTLEEGRQRDRDAAHADHHAATDRLDALESLANRLVDDSHVALSQIALLVTQVDEHAQDLMDRGLDADLLYEELYIVKDTLATHDILLGIDDEE